MIFVLLGMMGLGLVFVVYGFLAISAILFFPIIYSRNKNAKEMPYFSILKTEEYHSKTLAQKWKRLFVLFIMFIFGLNIFQGAIRIGISNFNQQKTYNGACSDDCPQQYENLPFGK